MTTPIQTAGPASSAGTPASLSQAFASDVTAGSTVIALVYGANWGAASTHTFTATDGVAFTFAAKSGALTDDKTLCAILYRDNHPGGPCTVTVTPSNASAQRMQLVILEVSGLDTTNSLEDTTAASGTGTAIDAGNLVTAGGAFLVQMSVANSGYTTISAGSGFTSAGFTVLWTGVLGESRTVTAGTHATPSTLNTSSQWQAIGAAFKAAGGGGTPVGLATETDTALALAAKQITATGLATETDTALALTTTAGFDFHTAAGLIFGDLAGALTGLAREASVSMVLRVYAVASPGSLVHESGTLTTDSNGRLPRFTHSSLSLGTSYICTFIRASDGEVVSTKLTAT